MKLQLLLLTIFWGSAFGMAANDANDGWDGNEANYVMNDDGSFKPEELRKFCESLPSTEGMDTYYYHMPHCDGGNSDGPGCTIEQDRVLDLSVLKYNIECFAQACDSLDSDEQSTSDGVNKCMRNLEIQFKNTLQFTPEGYQQQKEKACQCKYDEVERLETEDGRTHVCDMRWTYGCDPLGRNVNLEEEEVVPDCMNVASALYGKNECDPDEQMGSTTQDLIEYLRVKKLCEPSVKTMLMSEKVVEPICREQALGQDRLIQGCTSQCYANLEDRVELSKYQYVGYDPEYSTEYFDEDCEKFEVGDNTYYSLMVKFQGKQNVWKSTIDMCKEFRQNEAGKVPEPIMFTPITRNVMPFKKVEAAFDKCCDEGKSTYDDKVKGRESLDGKMETECLEKEGVMVDFGFMPGLLRGLLTKYYKKDWRVCSEYDDSCTPIVPNKNGKNCNRDLKKEDQMLLREGQAGPDQIFWFLRYLNDEENLADKGQALKACSDGAAIGRTSTMLPGLSLGLEAQEYAADAPTGSQSVSMLAFYTCAVFSSVHANNYFDIDAECNPHALNLSFDNKDC